MADSLSSLGAVASGIDYRTLVDQIIKMDRRPADRMQATIDTNVKRTASFNQFQALLGTLKNAAEALRDGSALDAFTSSVQGTDAKGRTLFAATTSADAAAGAYTVEVRSLTTTQKNVGAVGFGTAALGFSGTVQLTGAVGEASITLDGTETLAGVRDAFNAATTRTGVQATIVNGGAGDQRLVLTSTRAGAAGRFTLADVPPDPLPDPAPASLVGALGVGVPTIAGDDAEIVIDDAITVRRPSNTIADAIPGVTLTLQNAAVGTKGTLDVARVKSSATDAATAFVNAYNDVQAFIGKQTGKGGGLANDSFVRGMRSELSRLVATPGGVTLPADLRSLGALGIEIQKDGKLKLDSARFGAAYDGRLGELRTVLADRMATFTGFVDPIARTGGTIDSRESSIEITNAQLGKRIEDVDARLDKRRSALLAQWSKFEATIGRLNSIGSQMSAQFTGLVNSQKNG